MTNEILSYLEYHIERIVAGINDPANNGSFSVRTSDDPKAPEPVRKLHEAMPAIVIALKNMGYDYSSYSTSFEKVEGKAHRFTDYKLKNFKSNGSSENEELSPYGRY